MEHIRIHRDTSILWACIRITQHLKLPNFNLINFASANEFYMVLEPSELRRRTADTLNPASSPKTEWCNVAMRQHEQQQIVGLLHFCAVIKSCKAYKATVWIGLWRCCRRFLYGRMSVCVLDDAHFINTDLDENIVHAPAADLEWQMNIFFLGLPLAEWLFREYMFVCVQRFSISLMCNER